MIEHKRDLIEQQLMQQLYHLPNAPQVYGKHAPNGEKLLRDTGQLCPEQLATALRVALPDDAWHLRARSVHERWQRALPQVGADTQSRSPFFCSGCPHNSGTKTADGEPSLCT